MIKLENLKKEYGGRLVLDIGKFEFADGKTYALVGANGSGKSTLLRIIAGLEKPSEGKANYEKCAVGYMPQRSFGFSMSVLSNMLVSFEIGARNTKEASTEILDTLGLSALKKKNASKLSGGETQRLALARIFTRKCGLLLLDEPTASMDVKAAMQAESALCDYLLKNDSTLVFATHSVKQAERIADVVIFLSGGKIAEYGEAKKIFAAPISEELKEFLKSV